MIPHEILNSPFIYLLPSQALPSQTPKKKSGIFSRSDFIQDNHPLCYFIPLIIRTFVVISSTWCFFLWKRSFIIHPMGAERFLSSHESSQDWKLWGGCAVRGPRLVIGALTLHLVDFYPTSLIATMLYRPPHLPHTIIISPTIGNEWQWSGCHATSNCLCNSKSLDSYATRNQLLSLSQLKGNDKKNTTVA